MYLVLANFDVYGKEVSDAMPVFFFLLVAVRTAIAFILFVCLVGWFYYSSFNITTSYKDI